MNTTALRLGDIAPDFTQISTIGPISLYQWMGSDWCVLFSHPKDFTPVCTTELGELSRLKPEFDRRHCKVLGLSVDSLQDHKYWMKDIEATQKCSLNFPLLADADQKVSKEYGMVHPNANTALTVRTVFVIDPKKRIRLTISYPPSTGRNFKEILRAIDSLQITDSNKVATPVNWEFGDRCIILPSVSDEEASELFPEGWDEQCPYLRYVKQPEV
ncbi:peroxiredoxin [Microbulbifer pacificus]|uniref:peroxiredoxin n=1 Tax=Microbulbifer pacificus TaxID=407164 RepID=UPI001F1E50C8|nr:peroxiredoxin [Microbulbifer pacificus]